MPRLRSLILVMLGFLPSAAVYAEDWPQFRGPTGQGLAEGSLPTVWSKTSHVAWKQTLPGSGWSSPIIHKGRVYLTASVPVENSDTKDFTLRTLCLDAGTGKVIWDCEVFKLNGKKAPRIHTKNSQASPSPLTDGERIYVHFGHLGTAAVNFDGKIVWKTEVKYSPVHGNGGTPVLAGEALIFSCDGGDKQFVAALDRKNGVVLWKTDRKTAYGKKFAFSTPLLISVNGQEQIVIPAAGFVAAYEPKSGEEIWRVEYDGYSVVPRPAFGHGLVFLSSGYDAPTTYAIRPDGKGNVTKTHVAWTLAKGAPLTPSPLVVGDELYLISDNGVASCLDAKSGKVHWQERIGGNHSASPICADGKIYFQSEDGTGYIVKADKKFELIGRNEIEERTLASCAVSDGALYLRTNKHLYKIQR